MLDLSDLTKKELGSMLKIYTDRESELSAEYDDLDSKIHNDATLSYLKRRKAMQIENIKKYIMHIALELKQKTD